MHSLNEVSVNKAHRLCGISGSLEGMFYRIAGSKSNLMCAWVSLRIGQVCKDARTKVAQLVLSPQLRMQSSTGMGKSL